MEQLFFTITFTYKAKPGFIQVDLSADIEMLDRNTCLVRNIRRINTQESPLLPILKLTKNEDFWRHYDTGNESEISKTIGEAINEYLKQLTKTRDEMKDNL